jgi:hypothetical protein
VNLLEFERVEVVWESIVGCVLEVYGQVSLCKSGRIGRCSLPASEWTAIFCVAAILKAMQCAGFVVLV